jgi:hypothetical protein
MTSGGASDADGEVSAETTGDVPSLDRGFITCHGHVWEGPSGIENLVADASGECESEIGGVGDLHHTAVWIATQIEGWELLGDVDRIVSG